MSAEKVLEDAGERDRWELYAARAEMAVAGYLQIEAPGWVWDVLHQANTTNEEDAQGLPKSEELKIDSHPTEVPSELALVDMLQHISVADLDKKDHTHYTERTETAAQTDILLDTLPETFVIEQKMIYGNFAQLWPYAKIRHAIGWKQISFLRQFADLLDPEGRELFYYYSVPHLWLSRPSPIGKTISSEAHVIWQYMSGPMKKEWKGESAALKKLLGDGSTLR